MMSLHYISLWVERQSGALLERYLGEHSSGFDNLNHFLLWQKKRLKVSQAFRMRA